jgi:hypothetical protein
MVSFIDKLHLHKLFPLIRTEIYNVSRTWKVGQELVKSEICCAINYV